MRSRSQLTYSQLVIFHAYEMGLGKSIQAIAAMEIYFKHFGVSRVLVICPTSLKYQWQSEVARFCGRAARVVAGGRAQRQIEFTADEVHIADRAVPQPQLGVSRLIPTHECRTATSPPRNMHEREFNVLTGSQFIGRVVGAVAVVLARTCATDLDPITGLCAEVGDAILRQERLTADVLKVGLLIAAKLLR